MSSDAAFVGSIPELYDRHLGPVLFEPYAIDLAARLPPGANRVLEIAAGTGRVTRHLAARASTGQLIASDLNPAMLAIGRAQVGERPHVEWRTADAQALPFEDSSFDAVVCQFGLMFCPDHARAVSEMRRVLRPGGTLLVSVWDVLERNRFTVIIHQLMLETFANDPPMFYAAPFCMGDAHATQALFGAAGFAHVALETVAKQGVASSAADLAMGLVHGNPLALQLVERGADLGVLERRLIEILVHQCGDHPCVGALSAHVITAVR